MRQLTDEKIPDAPPPISHKELAEIREIVESLRSWAELMQKNMPSDAGLSAAVDMLAQPENRISIYQYLEINLPLIPGIIHYKVEIGSEHKDELLKLYDSLIKMWRKIKRRWGGK